ncbi:MAG: hypothetical protein GX957_07135 [Clostridiaceae bacterium]|nr:hypothetical protein [Clostridiaceae bacterium]
MDRKEALKILGLNEDATNDEINKRMNILYRKFRQIEKDENGYTLEDIDKAYRIASGISYHDPVAEQKKKQRQENPNFIFKLLKIDEEKARNFIYYYKWHALIGLVVLAILITTIISFTTRVEPDLRILVVGELFLPDTTVFEERISEELDSVEEALVQNVFLGGNDPQLQMGMQMKYVAELAGGDNDIFIVDEEKYFEIAKQGGFKPVAQVTGNFDKIDLNEHSDLIVKIDSDDDTKHEPELYGIDVTESSLLKEAGIIGNRLIIAFPHTITNTDNAIEFFNLVVK